VTAGAPEGRASTAGAPPARPVPGPVRRWVLGARPRTLPAAIVPVLAATAAAHPLSGHGTHGTGLPADSWWRALGALVVSLAIQVGTNYANDYSDGIRGTDAVRVGPVRLVASGLAPPRTVRRAALMSFGIAAGVGLALASVTSWWILVVGAASFAAGWFYTGGPRPYGYAGWGELFVFVFFGLVATVGSYYVQTLRVSTPVVWFAGAAVGLLAVALLEANNLRDIAGDAASAKRTLAVRLGRRRAGRLYTVTVALPLAGTALWGAISVAGVVASSRPAVAFLPVAAAPLALAPVVLAGSDAEDRALLPMLAATGRLQLAFGILLAASLWLWVP
jgi:1,4-dihydroxy-2-naphthoate polyprenyltransferase